MTTAEPGRAGARVDVAGMHDPAGRVCLSYAPDTERAALLAGTMVDDALRLGVRVLAPGSPVQARSGDILHVHVGPAQGAPRTDLPRLLVAPPVAEYDTRIRLPDGVVLALDRLGWSDGRDGIPLLGSDRGPVCGRIEGGVVLHADLPGVFGRESVRHATADADVRAILGAVFVLRTALAGLVPVRRLAGRAVSLITVDAEDQQRYFMNARGVCSNIRGAPGDDLLLARSCRTIMDRCEAFGLKAVFMVTGDNLDPGFVDAFGDRLIALEDNCRVLGEIAARGHDVACHAFDHDWWLSKGRSANAPLSTKEKLAYFFETSGDLRTLAGLAAFLARHGRALYRARERKNRRERTVGTPFTVDEVRADLDRWMRLVGFAGDRLFIRYPGFVRSAATVELLHDRFTATVDSSDLFDLDPPLPIFPYSVLAERDGTLYRSRVTEIPCLFIDRILRTRDQAKVEAYLDRLGRAALSPGSVLSFITHTKVLGGAWGHCHLYLHDPLRGMALPMIRESWERFARFLAAHTLSFNWRDLESGLYGRPA